MNEELKRLIEIYGEENIVKMVESWLESSGSNDVKTQIDMLG